MKVQDLIDELSRFSPHDNVCIEMTRENTRALDGEDCATNMEVDSVLPENTARHGVKLTMI